MTLRLQREAARDIEKAAFWYDSQRLGLGTHFADEIYAIFDRIEESPRSFPVVHESLRRAVVRVFPFCVFFRETADAIDIVAVLHGSRDPVEWQSRV